MSYKNTVITGSGSYIPAQIIQEDYFKNHDFYNQDSSPVKENGANAARKLAAITGIRERRYASKQVVTSDMGGKAAEMALRDADIDWETLDQIIVAQNFGDVAHGSAQGETVPSVASRVKHILGIENPDCVAYDVVFGCPGWVQGMIQAYSYVQSGMAKKCLVIGAETLSRVSDPHDRDSMIYADGAGAVVLQQVEEEEERGILAVGSKSFTKKEAYYLFSDKTNHPDSDDARIYMKMYGRKIYEFALNNVPPAMKEVLDQSGREISDLKKIFIHQANEKMDEAIVKRFYQLYEMKMPEKIMPMTVNTFGNSSVATVPTLYDLVKRGKLEGHSVKEGDLVLFASVGAGMNVNAVVYEV